MSTDLEKREVSNQIERVLIGGDISQLKPEERVSYYKMVCDSVGLNPLTKPFEYITLNGKLTLYARKDCTDQLRNIHNISVTIVARELTEDCYVVTAQAKKPSGRTDESIGAVPVGGLKGDAKCNAMMKAETKAKRRVTLSICGLGILDETEIETIPSATPFTEPKRTTETRTFGHVTSGGSPAAEDVNKGPDSAAPPVEVVAEAQAEDYSELAKRLEQSIECIAVGQQKNLHKRFREVLSENHPDLADKADDYLYQWLAEKGYRDKNKLPSASAIPASGWFQVRDNALAYAKTLRMER